MNDRVRELILLAQKGDEAAKSLIIKENSGLIWSVVRRFNQRGCDAEDLFQIGAIGLLKCIDKFDMSYNVEFSTYAVPMILGEVRRFLRDDGMIKVSRPLKEMAVKVKSLREAMTKQNGSEPSINELAGELGVDAERINEALEAARDVESIHRTVYQKDGKGVFLVDFINGGENDEQSVVDILTLKEVMKKMGQEERKIITLRYFEDKTQSEIAKRMGISQVQVSRIEKKAKEFIRNSMVGEEIMKDKTV